MRIRTNRPSILRMAERLPGMLLILLMFAVLVGAFAALAVLVLFSEDILRPR